MHAGEIASGKDELKAGIVVTAVDDESDRGEARCGALIEFEVSRVEIQAAALAK